MKFHIKQWLMRSWKAAVLLALFSLLSGLIWRAEIEWWWGWKGLNWLNGVHFSAILIPALFATWLYFFVPCPNDKRKRERSFLAMGGGLAAYWLYDIAFSLSYDRCFFLLLEIIFQKGELAFFIHYVSLPLISIIIPLTICHFASKYNSSLSHWRYLYIPILYNASFLLALFLLDFFHHKGNPDIIHTVKSGFVFPGLFFWSGIAFIATVPPPTT